jgi:glycosyltransferase involved in cell wall biosynthesis
MERLKKDGVIGAGEVILVNDGCTDATLAPAKEVRGVAIVTYSKNRGPRLTHTDGTHAPTTTWAHFFGSFSN